MGNRATQAHGVTTKFFPFILVVFVFLYTLEFTRERFLFIAPEDLFMGSTIIFAGLIFIYEGFQSKAGGNTGFSVAFVLLFGLGAVSLIFGVLTLLDIFDPIGSEGIANYALVFTLVGAMLVLGAGAIYEIILSKRLHKVLL